MKTIFKFRTRLTQHRAGIFLKPLMLVTLLLTSQLLTSQVALADLPLMFEQGSINQPPAGSMMAAGYLKIKNTSDTDLRIVSARSDRFKMVELHLTTMEGDVAKMRKQKFIEVKAGGSLELKHGAHHLMLMGMKKPLDKGESILVTFVTDAGDEFEAELLVK